MAILRKNPFKQTHSGFAILPVIKPQFGATGDFVFAEFNEKTHLDSKHSPCLYKSSFWETKRVSPREPALFNPGSFQYMGKDNLPQENPLALSSPPLDRANFDFSVSLSQQRENFERDFAFVQNKIQKGNLEKAVIYSYFAAKLRTKMPVGSVQNLVLSLFTRVLNSWNHPRLFPYAWLEITPQGYRGTVGLSPEFLLATYVNKGSGDLEKVKLETMSLAGTFDQSRPDGDVLSDFKLLREQELVTKDIVSRLELDISLPPPGIIRYPRLGHLISSVSFEAPKSSKALQEKIERLHPTPALGGSPRGPELNETLESLSFSEKRHFFGAPLGFIDLSEGARLSCLVAIRGIEFELNSTEEISFHLFSGCGITAQSRDDEEFKETQLKRSVVLKSLGLENWVE